MKFGELPLSECIGCILAHSQSLVSKDMGSKDQVSERVPKGTVLDKSLIEKFQANGFQTLTVAHIDAGDVEENIAAEKLASAFIGTGVHVEKAHTGRVNIYASTDGLLDYDAASLIAANSVCADITIAVVAPDQWVLAGRMVASAKIIPYAVSIKDLEAAIGVASRISVHSPKPMTAALIQTVLPTVKEKVLDKTERVTEQRLKIRGSDLVMQDTCEHQVAALANAIKDTQSSGEGSESKPDMILIVGASAISDRCDVIPAAVESVGGIVKRVGLPVDPGNLLMLAEYNGTPVLGLPGCARSPKHNGLDLLLDRIVCDVDITDAWLNGLCIGGLLGEAHDRPQPRAATKSKMVNSIAALILAAGSSRRAGSENKLLHSYHSKAMVCAVVESVLDSKVTESLVVTGHQSEQVEEVLKPYDIPVCYSPRYAEGMAHTIAAGLSRLQQHDAVVVCLGDMPHVTAKTINKVISSHDNSDYSIADRIFVPVYGGVRGNPVMVGRTFYDTLLKHEGDSGARFLMKQYPDQVVEVEIDDESILKDYDTPESLQKLSPQ